MFLSSYSCLDGPCLWETNWQRELEGNGASELFCLSGITCHVLHKLRNSSKMVGRVNEVQSERRELGEHLIINEDNHYDLSSENDEKSDTQILFDILRSRDR